jgi:hypothetical protein
LYGGVLLALQFTAIQAWCLAEPPTPFSHESVEILALWIGGACAIVVVGCIARIVRRFTRSGLAGGAVVLAALLLVIVVTGTTTSAMFAPTFGVFIAAPERQP